MTTTTELVRMENISKSFGKVQALRDVTLSVNSREIVGLLGDNGAGKSTLIKILSGALQATSGQIYYKGQPVRIRNTTDAINLGIETIYQDSALVPQLSIARNLFLGREPMRGPSFLNRLDQELMSREVDKLLKQVGISKDIDPHTPITSLSGGERQSIAIARAMYFESDLIVLDEPTNNLGVDETQGVLRFIRGARDAGHSCIFIAHNIYHVFQVVDRIVILRRGRKVAEVNPKESTIEQVEKIITGLSEGSLERKSE
jgi:simple sugar transport system ATP-binding protein